MCLTLENAVMAGGQGYIAQTWPSGAQSLSGTIPKEMSFLGTLAATAVSFNMPTCSWLVLYVLIFICVSSCHFLSPSVITC